MKKSAMLHAFKVIGQKPMVLLLILPIQALSVLSLKFMPDMTKFLDMNYLMSMNESSDPSFIYSYMSSFMVYFLISSVISLFTLAAMFLLTPPSMELFRDGAAGVETEPGWYMRGLRKHWWKPIVASLVLGAATSIIGVVLYIIFLILSMIAVPLLSVMFANPNMDYNSSSDLFSNMNSTMLITVIISASIGLLFSLPIVFVEAMFATFLPALADRSFGEAFKLVFSKKGFRQVPKAFGGYLLLALVSGIIMAVFIGGYILLTGIPDGVLGYYGVFFKFLSSWAGVFSMLLVSLTVVIRPAYQFCIYQQIKDDEAAALIKE